MTRGIRTTTTFIAVVMLAMLVGFASTPTSANAGSSADTAISGKVRAAIERIPGLTSPQYVKVQTNKGVVTLIGYVDTRSQIATANDKVGKVEGVKSVKNHLVVKRYAPGNTAW